MTIAENSASKGRRLLKKWRCRLWVPEMKRIFTLRPVYEVKAEELIDERPQSFFTR
jgi:hypothetical protein